MQRWSLHILPKGFTRSRCYGGYHGSKRSDYVQQCRELLAQAHDADESHADDSEPAAELPAAASETHRKCPHCNASLILILSERRPSWREIFEREIYRQPIYSPQHHIGIGRSPPATTQSP
jgi:hypothetical protein